MKEEPIQHIPYNTEETPLKLPEYGRWVLQMVEKVKQISDRGVRYKQAQKIISVMENLTPEWKGVEGYEQKLWDHLAYLADYDLDIDWPVEVRRFDEAEAVQKLSYPGHDIQYMHYGYLIEKYLQKVGEVEDEVQREYCLHQAVQRMKKDLVEWKGDQEELKAKLVRDIEKYTQGKVNEAEVLAAFDKKIKSDRNSKKK